MSATIVEGSRGEFSVWVNGRCVAKKDSATGFPADDDIVKSVKAAIADPSL